MKFTDKDLATAMGLKVGDKIKVEGYGNVYEYEITPVYDLSGRAGIHYDLYCLINKEYEILPPIINKECEILPPKKTTKKVGDSLCSNNECVNCPLCVINCKGFGNDTLYEQLKKSVEGSDHELYNVLKVRLDKEI